MIRCIIDKIETALQNKQSLHSISESEVISLIAKGEQSQDIIAESMNPSLHGFRPWLDA